MKKLQALLLSSVVATAGYAQQPALRSIVDTTSTMSDEKLIAPYTFARCAGLYDGMIGYAGTNLPEDMRTEFRDGGTVFTFASAVTKLNNAFETDRGPKKLDPHIDQSVLEVSRFKDLYIERFSDNYAVSGSMLEADDMAKADVLLCQQIFPKANSIAIKTLGN